jgi:hypothetical protein
MQISSYILTIETPTESTVEGLRVAERPVFQNGDPSAFVVLYISKAYAVLLASSSIYIPFLNFKFFPLFVCDSIP